MISIIVSSYQDILFANFEASVVETIGVEYEIIRIYNPGLMSICAAYNTGVSKARFNLLCFCHEDVLFKTDSWGKIVIEHFQNDPQVGLLGIAGTTYKTATPAGWGFVSKTRLVNIIQHHKFLNLTTYRHYENPKNTSLAPVACIDGVWMCTTKKIASRITFDQHTLTSFHCYDIDFSLSVLQQYTVAVTFDILLEHFSEGKNDRLWIEENIKLHRKWRHFLPVNIEGLPLNEVKNYETKAGIEFVHMMNQFGFSTAQRLNLLFTFFWSKYMHKLQVISLAIRIMGSYLKKQLTFK